MYENYEKIRIRKGLTNRQVSLALGLPTSTISDWKTGRHTPRPETISRIADYLGVSVDYLESGNEETAKVNNNEPAKSNNDFDNGFKVGSMFAKAYQDKEMLKCFENIQDLSEEDRQTIYAMTKRLKAYAECLKK